MDELYDVIIAGGGPAGGSAAYFLCAGGKKVLVLEKETLPRYKTCGGGISPIFLQSQFPFSFKPILQTDVTALGYAFGGQIVSIPVASGALSMVMRADLDAYLLRQSGAAVMDGVAVSGVDEHEDRVAVHTRDGRTFFARYLIGADGANSRVASALGLRRKRTLAAALEAEVSVPPNVMRRFGHQPVFIFGEIRHGYAWIFPKPDHLSVGIASLKPKPGQLQTRLRQVMSRYNIDLADIPLYGHPIPIYTRRGPVATRRTLLVGDAAGLVDPLSGEGIRWAIKSGRLAAELLLKGQPEQYSRALFREIGVYHILTLWVARLFYLLEDLCLYLGTPNPFSTQAVLDLLSDQITTPDLLITAVMTLPVFLLTEASAEITALFGKRSLAERIRRMVYPPMVGAPQVIPEASAAD